MLDLGEFSLGINNQDVIDGINSIPPYASVPIGTDETINFLFDGDEESGLLVLAIDGNQLYFNPDESLWLDFNGQLTLTAHRSVVPEPATMLLFSSGMFGGIFFKRRKKIKS